MGVFRSQRPLYSPKSVASLGGVRTQRGPLLLSRGGLLKLAVGLGDAPFGPRVLILQLQDALAGLRAAVAGGKEPAGSPEIGRRLVHRNRGTV